MSITSPANTPVVESPSPQPDPFRYGFRYVLRPESGLAEEFDQIPLTPEDVLYPEVGDFIVQTTAHQRRCRYLANVLIARLADDQQAVVLHDVRLAWDIAGMRPNGPDIAVIFGVQAQRDWATFDCAEEGVRPALIIEVTSPATRKFDLFDKVELFARGGVPQYVVVDAHEFAGAEAVHLLGYRLTPKGYEIQPTDARGRLWLASVGLWLGIENNEVFLFGEQGDPISDYTDLNTSRALAEERAQAEAAARALAEERAQAEAAARALAEEQLRAVEAELQRLRGGT